MSVIEFGRNVVREAKKVIWPGRQEVVASTIAIVVLALIAGVFFFAVDSAVGAGVRFVLSPKI